jgi:DNA-binding NtrC family response regulator
MSQSILFIIDQGGYPLYTDSLLARGYQIETVGSTRKAMALLKKQRFDLIIAEFNYGPRYGVLISNLEPLLSQLKMSHPETRVIVFCEQDYVHHLDTLRKQFKINDALVYPVPKEQLLSSIQQSLLD